jgi:hypothetical protein
MTMGFDDDGDPTAGQTEEAGDTAEDGMDLEETTEAVTRKLRKNSMNSSLQKEATKTTGGNTDNTATTTTGMKKIDEEDEEEEEEEILGMKNRNWRKINLSFAVVLDGQDGEDGKERKYEIPEFYKGGWYY